MRTLGKDREKQRGAEQMERDEEMYGMAKGTNARLQTERNRTPSFTAIPDPVRAPYRPSLKLDNVYALSVTLHSSINDSPSSRSEKQVANQTHEIGHVQCDPILTASTGVPSQRRFQTVEKSS
jgi:hypothetical protein